MLSEERRSGINAMRHKENLQEYLRHWAGGDDMRFAVETTINRLLEGTVSISEIASFGALAGDLAGEAGGTNEDGDTQKMFDVKAHEILMEACSKAPVAVVGSEEAAEVIELDRTAPLAVVMDPLDGSSNIETNAPIGTIFSIYAVPSSDASTLEHAVLQAGVNQLAAGYIIYGTQTSLVLTVGEGTHIFTLDHKAGEYRLIRKDVTIPHLAKEYAINASNHSFWDGSIQNYVQDCIMGYADHKQKFNMRWIASLVAEAHRIFVRGGVFLYPGDSREGYQLGRLRLVYEANAMAFLMEQAGGSATDCVRRIMDIEPESLHQRTPLVMGSKANVSQVARYQNLQDDDLSQAPLFGSRGLFSSGRGNY